MIIGIGCDIVSVSRIKQAVESYGERFLKRIYTAHELARAPKGEQRYNYLAKRFAAKEALAKAMGTGIGAAIAFADIEVYNHESGAPGLRLLNDLALASDAVLHLSLADDAGMAQAYVIIEKR
ncbi:MAG: holo-ACP synthase [Proteobacteria bacterium]|nr:holo-ACP synthase [Pseudomonadota bacterium]